MKRKSKTTKSDLTLPEGPEEAIHDFDLFTWLFYGREKIGKTALASMFPDTLFLMTEPGGRGLSLSKVEVTNWPVFKDYVRMLERKRSKFRTLCLDTADNLFLYCTDYICQRLGIDHPADEEWGKGWGLIRREFQIQCSRLCSTGRGVIFTSHAKEFEIKRSRNREQISRVVPTLANQARQVIEPIVDIWTYMEYNDEGERILHLRGNDSVSAGHRLEEHFKGYDYIPMGKSREEAFNNLVAAFNNELEIEREEVKQHSTVKARKKLRKKLVSR